MELKVNDINIRVLDINSLKESAITGKNNCINQLKKEGLTDKQIEDGLRFVYKIYHETQQNYDTKEKIHIKDACYLDVLQYFYNNNQIETLKMLYGFNEQIDFIEEADGEKYSIIYEYNEEFTKNTIIFVNGNDINKLVYYKTSSDLDTKSYDNNDVPNDLKDEALAIINALSKE